ncbi:MAG: hypothetical protein GY729_05635 [Desulfobacteraceae bacterium]|nr:hypothetical protein [Desulfobacteraceae bacterium]
MVKKADNTRIKTATVTNYIVVDPKLDAAILPPIKSIIVPLGAKPPQGRLISAFGNKSTNDIMRHVRRKANKEEKYILRVDSIIDRGDLSPEKICTIKSLPKIKFLKLDRLASETSEKIYNIIHLPSDGDQMDTHSLITTYPERLNRIFNHPDFAHVNAIAWKAMFSQKPLKRANLAAIRSPDIFVRSEIRNYTGNSPMQFEI